MVDAGTGQVLRSNIVSANVPGRTGQAAESALIDRLVFDIRALLGLSGVAPHPVGGIKRAVAWPQLKPETLEISVPDDAALLSDPLLNGTVTPTSLNLDAVPDTGPALDLSRPLLTPEPVEAPLTQEAVAPVEPVNLPKTFELPAAPPVITVAPAPATTGEEPCIITLDNDCSDPDSQ